MFCSSSRFRFGEPVASVEQIRRRRSARLKGMAFLYVRDGKMNRVDVGACL